MLSLQSTRSFRTTWAKVSDDEVCDYILPLDPVEVEINLSSAAKVLFSSAVSRAPCAIYDDFWISLRMFFLFSLLSQHKAVAVAAVTARTPVKKIVPFYFFLKL
jgi:hypothetical protein